MNTTGETMGAQHRPRIMLADKPLVKISLEISGNEKEDINTDRYYGRMLMKRGGCNLLKNVYINGRLRRYR